MDRYIVREPRVGGEYMQGNPNPFMYPSHIVNNVMNPEGMYYGTYAAEFPNVHRVAAPRFMGPPRMNTSAFTPTNIGQGHVSGIDPTYLGAFSNNNVSYIASGSALPMELQSAPIQHALPFGNDYQQRHLMGADRMQFSTLNTLPYSNITTPENTKVPDQQIKSDEKIHNQTFQGKGLVKSTKQPTTKVVEKKLTESEVIKEIESPVLSRSQKLQELHNSGPRVFSGNVEKVLKWHKDLQDIGVLVLYEIIAKCVNVRPGESCAIHLVVRDENGPAMQVTYYQIDFMLPELKVPCNVRMIGKMISGTSRYQAYSVREATADDAASLPRSLAVSDHHVAKLSEHYGKNKN